MTAGRTTAAAFWRQRTRREQAYLGVMLVSVAAFAYWFALVTPLRSLAADAERRHVAAQAQQARFPGVLEELARRQQPPMAALDVESLLRSAAAAGIGVSPDATSGQGRLTLRFEAAPAQAVFGWLSQLRDEHGLSPLKASVRRVPSGVEGELVFAVAGP